MALIFDGAGTITGLQVGGLPDGTVDQDTLAANSVSNAKLATGTPNAAALPSGSILQVVNSVKTAPQSFTSYADITDLSLDITMTSATNRILVIVSINHIGISDGNGVYFKLLRGTTVVTESTAGGGTDTNNACLAGGGGGYSANDRQRDDATLTVLDTPGTGTHTYKVQGMSTGGTGWINRWALNTDAATVSSITLMEVAV
jgi:hypothetical protein